MGRFDVCIIVKNEARYIAEWIEYHLMIGVERIVVYNNGSEDDLATACAPYPQLHIIDWPIRGDQQRLAYQHYLTHLASGADWVAFIDADEFICFRGPGTLADYLAQAAARHAALEMPWVIFDTNGHDQRPDGLVLEHYTRAHRVAPQQNVKSICQPSLVDHTHIVSPHRFRYHSTLTPLETAIPTLCVFHYMLRSRVDVWAKVARGDVWSSENERKRLSNIDQSVAAILLKYEGADTRETHMLQFIPELRQRLQARLAVRAAAIG